MENSNELQDKINAVCEFLQSATDDSGKKVFAPMLYAEDWKSLVTYLLDNDITDLHLGDEDTGDSERSLRQVAECTSSLDFLYTFFQRLDNINLFDILEERFLTKNTFCGRSRGEFYTSEVIIPGHVKALSKGFFEQDRGLTKLTFQTPSQMTTLPAAFLMGAVNLKELTISNKIQIVDVFAIDTSCDDLKIHVIKEVDSKWHATIRGSNSVIDFWRDHIVKG